MHCLWRVRQLTLNIIQSPNLYTELSFLFNMYLFYLLKRNGNSLQAPQSRNINVLQFDTVWRLRFKVTGWVCKVLCSVQKGYTSNSKVHSKTYITYCVFCITFPETYSKSNFFFKISDFFYLVLAGWSDESGYI